MIINPLEAYKIASILTLTPRFEILGPAGIYALNSLGKINLFILLVSIQLAWVVLPIILAVYHFCYLKKEEL